MSRSLFIDAFGHHVWASIRLIDACSALTPEQLQTTVPGTFGSILETMRHLVGADRAYLELHAGGRLAPIGEDDELAMDLAAMREVMTENGPVWAWLAGQDLDADVVITRHRDDGSTSSAPLGVRLVQVVHHGTDHRSQICTALTALGIEPPAIDVWDYANADGRLSDTPPRA